MAEFLYFEKSPLLKTMEGLFIGQGREGYHFWDKSNAYSELELVLDGMSHKLGICHVKNANVNKLELEADPADQ